MDSIIQTALAPRKSECLAVGTSVTDPPVTPGKDRVLKLGLPGCPYRFLESGELPFTDGNPAFGLQLHHPRFLELVGAVHHRSRWRNWARNRQWQRPLIYNGMQV